MRVQKTQVDAELWLMAHPQLRGDDSKKTVVGDSKTVAATVVAAASPRAGSRPRSCSGEIRDEGWRAMFDEGVTPENAINAIFAKVKRDDELDE